MSGSFTSVRHLFFYDVDFMCETFYSKYKPVIDEAYLHILGVLVMIAALIFVIFGIYKERKIVV